MKDLIKILYFVSNLNQILIFLSVSYFLLFLW